MRPHPLSLPRSLFGLAVSFAACFTVSSLGAIVTAGPVRSWYPSLTKPAITPPDLAFPIVWTLLFAMMAVAAWRVWKVAGFGAGRGALALFGLQLALNLGWSVLFFGQQRIGLALAEIILLWLVIAATIRAFAGHDRAAAWLLAPYLAWVSYAAILNLLIWQMNPA